jgi:hypothetical protein
MRTLTIKQPFASLITSGIKTIETRSRRTHIRERILIHSAMSFDKRLLVYDSDGYGAWPYIDTLLERRGARWHVEGEYSDTYTRLPLSAIIGSVEIVDCIPADQWIEEHCGKGNVDKHEIYEREFYLGDMDSDRFCWVLKNPIEFENPVPIRGKQGFWNYNRDIIL